MNKKVLITGINGFTGKYVSQHLLELGYDVYGTSYYRDSKELFIQMDVTNIQSIKECLVQVKPNYIIHLAANSFIADDNSQDFYNVNLFGSLNLLQAILDLKLPMDKVLLASSANIYGHYLTGDSIDEHCPPNPVNHYAMSKLAMEYMSSQFREYIPLIITRPFNYTGPGQDKKFIIPKIVDHFQCLKKTIELGNVDVFRDFSDVRDIARYYVSLMESNINSGVFNLCSGQVFSIRDIISIMNEIAGYEIDFVINKRFVRKNEIKKLCGSNEKLKRLCNVFPKYTITQTLNDMYNLSCR